MRLRTQAFLISLSLIVLVGVLGIKAYSVAQSHIEETEELVTRNLASQALLFRIDAIIQARQLTEKKFQVTSDPAYEVVLQSQTKSLAAATQGLRQLLEYAYPDLSERASHLTSGMNVQKLRRSIEIKGEEKLNHAQKDAQSLKSLILVALGLSMAITVWLSVLFYRDLIRPLSRIKEGTLKIRGGGDALSYRVGKVRGVTELRELADSFDGMAARLQDLDRAKSEFLATISHEIKNPLAALKEGMSLLVDRGENLSPAARAKGHKACLIASKRLEGMINNLLRLSKMEGGLFDFELGLKNLPAALLSAIDEVRPLAEKRGMTLHYQGLTELEAPFHWDGMLQVFVNVLSNAIKYGREGSVIEVKLEPVLKDERPWVEVSVINLGKAVPEIADGQSSRLFDVFYRGHASGSQGGMGIGLHVVKRIVEAHGGEVVASALEESSEMPPQECPKKESQSMKTRFQLRIPHVSGLLGALGMLMLSGCASSSVHPEEAATAIVLNDSGDLNALERELKTLGSGPVMIDAEVLAGLIREKRLSETRCRRQVDRLEALKALDLEEAGKKL